MPLQTTPVSTDLRAVLQDPSEHSGCSSAMVHPEQELSRLLFGAGYTVVKPMVFCGLFPTDNDQFETLRDSLGKLQLNDAALVYEPEVCLASCSCCELPACHASCLCSA